MHLGRAIAARAPEDRDRRLHADRIAAPARLALVTPVAALS
jgi:hypothetical protein